MRDATPLAEVQDLVKHFGSVIALSGVSLRILRGEIVCLLGDNGAGKSTLIKILSGVFRPTSGHFFVEGKPVAMASPRDAQALGIATVYQDLSMIPLMSITRNFVMGREPLKGMWPLRFLNIRHADQVTLEQMQRIGIDVRDPQQAVGTLSGGERQCIAIARAVYFGAKVLILDEPTSALGVHQTGMVLRYVKQVREKGLGVVFITHNAHHAYAVGDRFILLKRGRTIGTYARDKISIDKLQELMAGGRELQNLAQELGLHEATL